jgi:hypothetical protein
MNGIYRWKKVTDEEESVEPLNQPAHKNVARFLGTQLLTELEQ